MSEQEQPGIEDIAAMVSILQEGGWQSARITVGDFELSVSNAPLPEGGSPAPTPVAAAAEVPSAVRTPVPTPAPAPTSGAAPAQAPASTPVAGAPGVPQGAELVEVKAETLGAFWRSPQPGAAAFVEVGDTVEPATPLAIVEVMKMMTRITAGVAGTVVAIHAENGELIEAGQTLVTLAVG